MADDRRAAKQSVLTKVNSVLATAGLNDTVWSVRDCDSTLFVLMYKKIVGKVRHQNRMAFYWFLYGGFTMASAQLCTFLPRAWILVQHASAHSTHIHPSLARAFRHLSVA